MVQSIDDVIDLMIDYAAPWQCRHTVVVTSHRSLLPLMPESLALLYTYTPCAVRTRVVSLDYSFRGGLSYFYVGCVVILYQTVCMYMTDRPSFT